MDQNKIGNLIKELRKHISLYEKMVEDPKRMIDLIDRKRLLNSRVYSTRSGKPNYEKMLKSLVNDILTAPTVDTERHAHWIEHKEVKE